MNKEVEELKQKLSTCKKALENICRAYRRELGLDGAYDEELIQAEFAIKQIDGEPVMAGGIECYTCSDTGLYFGHNGELIVCKKHGCFEKYWSKRDE